MTTKRWVALVGAFAIAIQASVVYAVLVPASGVGSGVGWMEHAFGPTTGMIAGGPPALFNGYFAPNNAGLGDPTLPGTSGAMQQVGFNFPAFPGVPWPASAENDTGNFPMVANTFYNLGSVPGMGGTTFGGATTSMVGVGGNGRAGVAANFTLADATAVDVPVRVSTNTFGSMVVYNSVGVTNAQFGHWIAANAVVPADGSGFVEVGVKSIFEIGTHNPVTGAFTVDSFWEPLPILFAFDGNFAGLPDAIQAQFFSVAGAGGNASFGALSTTPITVIPAGKSVRMRSTTTLVADPATFDMLPLDQFPTVSANIGPTFFGTGSSTDAPLLLLSPIPEAGALLMLGVASTVTAGAVWIRRKRSAA